ncbi:hypothetical protein HK104_010145 [Borealophlyctis nickersoniae]|nr:hypothetical protein HK104_010145 [Borealophlyctis nickersoniae]
MTSTEMDLDRGGGSDVERDPVDSRPRSSRDKFHKEREDESYGSGEKDAFGRDKRPEDVRKRGRSQSASSTEADRSDRKHRRHSHDHYIPDYERDGYIPAPRFTSQNTSINGVTMMDSFGNPVFVPMPDGYDAYGMGRKGGADNGVSLPDPLELDYLVSPLHFAEYLRQQNGKKRRPSMKQSEIDRRYEIYKENFLNKQLEKFFEKEKDAEWFREKYHPKDSENLKKEVKRRRHELLVAFSKDLEDGKFDAVTFDEPTAPKIGDDETKGHDGAGNGASDPDSKEEPADTEPVYALFIKVLSVNIPRRKIIEVCQQVEGFKYLVLSDPKPEKNMHRLGWVVFHEGTDMASAKEELNNQKIGDFVIHVTMHHILPTRTRVAPGETNRPERLKHDLEQIKVLAKVLDDECDFPEGQGVAQVQKRLKQKLLIAEREASKADKDKKALDLHIEYLRKVHNYDYYGGIESSSPEDHARRSAVYLRRPASQSLRKEWTDRLDARVDLRIRKPVDGPEITKLGGKSLDVEIEKHLSAAPLIKMEEAEKWRCVECKKLFKGQEFVKKHVRTKHADLLQEVITNTTFYNNYVKDPNRVDVTKSSPSGIGASGSGIGLNGPLDSTAAAQMQLQFSAAAAMQGMLPMMPMGIPMVAPTWPMAMPAMMAGNLMGGSRRDSRGDPDYGAERNDDGRERRGNAYRTRSGPPPGRDPRADPRQIRSYTDLDKVADGDIEISYD